MTALEKTERVPVHGVNPSDEHIRLSDGVVPYRYLERIAIAHIDGGLSLREATRLASAELASEGIWIPGEP